MDKFLNKTAHAMSRFGEQMERQFGVDGHARSKSGMMFGGPGLPYNRPLDRRHQVNNNNNMYFSRPRHLSYSSMRNQSSSNLAPSSSFINFNNYPQNQMRRPSNDRVDRPPFGNNSAAALNYGHRQKNDGFAGGYGNPAENMGCCPAPVNVGCAPNYYVAERRQIELIPAPPPQYIPQPYPCAVPVDRPVAVPCAVPVPVAVPCDRPVPVCVPVAVPCDRPVPYPVPVCVPSPPQPPVCVPVPTPVPCYIPCCCPPPCCPPPCCPPPCCPLPCCPPPCGQQAPIMLEQTVTHNQRWFNASPAMGNNPYGVL